GAEAVDRVVEVPRDGRGAGRSRVDRLGQEAQVPARGTSADGVMRGLVVKREEPGENRGQSGLGECITSAQGCGSDRKPVPGIPHGSRVSEGLARRSWLRASGDVEGILFLIASVDQNV